MYTSVFNRFIAVGWFMVTAGGVWWFPPAGLVAGGLLALALTFLAVRMSGGLVNPEDFEPGSQASARRAEGRA
jgi:hypothetical protein